MEKTLEKIPVNGNVDIVVARNAVRHRARQIGFGLVDQSRVATAVSELSRNIVTYAKAGTVIVSQIESSVRKGIEIVCEDQGPGIENIEAAMSEGYTTAGSLGIGMPGAKKLMDEMLVWSEVGKGTRITIKKFLV